MSAAPAADIDTLRECAARTAGDIKGMDALERGCPGLRAAVADLGYSAALGDAEQRQLTASGLTDLAALAERYQAAKPGPRPDIAAVPSIVDALLREHVHSRSGWDALKAWLRSLLPTVAGRNPSWFDRFWDKVASAAGIMTAIAYALMFAVAVFAASVIVRELVAAGIFSRRQPASPALPDGPRLGPDGSTARGTLDGAPLLERPSVLLRLLVEGLSRRGRLHANRHLTHRELVAHAVLEDTVQRERFAKIAALAEAVLYGSHAPRPERIEEVIKDGRDLLGQIERSSTVA